MQPKKLLKLPVEGGKKPYPMPKITPSKPGAKKPGISVGGIGNKEVQQVYRNQGIF